MTMRAMRGTVAPAALAALLALAAGSPSSAQLPRPSGASRARSVLARAQVEEPTWHRVTTRGYVLLGEVPERTLRELAADLEALEALLAGLNPTHPTRPPPPASVLVFAGDATFTRFAPRSPGGTLATVSGFFLAHPHGDFIAVNGKSPDDLRGVLYHEALHRYLHHYLPQAPLWLNEGLAEFYRTLDVRRDEALVGLPVAAHLERLRRHPRRPLDELLRTAGDSHVYGHDRRGAGLYAESWAVMHTLLSEDGGRAAVARYAGLLRAGEDAVAAFVQAFGDTGALDRRIDAHLLEPVHPPLRARLPNPSARSAAGVAPPEADVEYELGWLLAHHAPPRVEEARRRFETALRRDPEHARALAGLGYLDELAGDEDGARLHYARAVELLPGDALLHFLLAQSTVRAAAALPEPERGERAAQEILGEARRGLRRSLELEPGFAEAWAALGAAWVADRAPAGEGLEALREAYRRLPTRDDVLYNVTLLEARLGSRARAEELLARLERRASADRVESAREALLRVDLERAERMLREGLTEPAVKIIARVLAETRDRELRAAVAARLEQLERAMAGAGNS